MIAGKEERGVCGDVKGVFIKAEKFFIHGLNYITTLVFGKERKCKQKKWLYQKENVIYFN